MELIDGIIISILSIIIGLVIYFSFVKNRGNACHDCPYSKNCDKSECFTNRNKKI